MSSPTNIVTFNEKKATDAQEYRFAFTLSGLSGHMAKPGYTVRTPEDNGNRRTSVECSHAGTVVLRYSFNIHGV